MDPAQAGEQKYCVGAMTGREANGASTPSGAGGVTDALIWIQPDWLDGSRLLPGQSGLSQVIVITVSDTRPIALS
jgi:hypothetical protein